VYKRDETKPLGWTQLGGDIDGEASQDYLGYSVSLSSDGNTLGKQKTQLVQPNEDFANKY